MNINNVGFTDKGTDGAYVGTSDKRRKIIGITIELEGDLADQYDVEYQAEIRNRSTISKAKNGAVCGTDNKRGAAIKEILINVKKKSNA